MGNVIEFIKYHLRMTKFSLPSSIRIIDIVQILLIAIFVYYLMVWIKNTRAYTLLKGVLIVSVFLIIAAILRMDTILWICQQLSVVAITGVLVIFQPELRRALERFGGRSLRSIWQGKPQVSQYEGVIAQVVIACETMSRQKVGALIVFERETSLSEFFKTGTILNAQVSSELIRNIFFPKASLHDGAMVIQGDRIAAAGCVLPLSENTHLSNDLGTRHRAGVGMSEVSDAVVVIVSEESGAISVAQGGMLKRHLAPQMLEKLLRNELIADEADCPGGVTARLRRRFGKEGERHEKK